jgi:hypothetical protein
VEPAEPGEVEAGAEEQTFRVDAASPRRPKASLRVGTRTAWDKPASMAEIHQAEACLPFLASLAAVAEPELDSAAWVAAGAAQIVEQVEDSAEAAEGLGSPRPRLRAWRARASLRHRGSA